MSSLVSSFVFSYRLDLFVVVLDCRICSMIRETPTTFLMDKYMNIYICVFNQFIVSFLCVISFCYVFIEYCIEWRIQHTVCISVSNTRTLFSFLFFSSIRFGLLEYTQSPSLTFGSSFSLTIARSLRVCMRG